MALTVQHKDSEIYLGEKSFLSLAKEKSFSELVFILLSEREPKPEELSVFELILNISIDHGSDTPSAKVLIEKAKSGGSMGDSLASGIREINDSHGGAQELLMPILYKMVKEKITAEDIVSEHKNQNKRLPGFGHRLYKENDPRAELLIELLQEKKLGEDYILAGHELQKTLFEILGKKLTLNIDGAIAIALCAFNFSPDLGKPIFIISRTAGLCAHYINNRDEK